MGIFLWATVKAAFSILGKVDLDSSALQPVDIQQQAVHQLEKLFKLNSITFFHVKYSIVALLKGITGDENCRWLAAGHLGPQKGICLT